MITEEQRENNSKRKKSNMRAAIDVDKTPADTDNQSLTLRLHEGDN